jgi:hypothetical protein
MNSSDSKLHVEIKIHEQYVTETMGDPEGAQK